MNYRKLKEDIKTAGFKISDVCKNIGMSETGFHLAVKNNTLKVRDLEKISNTLGVPVSSFFSDNDRQHKSASNEVNTLREKVKILEESIKDKNKIIRLLEDKNK